MKPDSTRHNPDPAYLRGLLLAAGVSQREATPRTGAQRKAKYRAQGRQIACVIRDPAALDALDRLVAKHGGVTAAVTAALVRAASVLR